MGQNNKTYKLESIAEKIGGRLDGDGTVEIYGVAPIQKAQVGDITFATNNKYLDQAIASTASAIIVPEDFPELEKPAIRVANPSLGFARALEAFSWDTSDLVGMHPTAVVGTDSKLGENVFLGPHVVIGHRCSIGDKAKIRAGTVLGDDVIIGEGTLLYPNVTVYDDVTIGKKVIIHSSTVIGSDGYGFVQEGGVHNKIPQIGTVIIGDNVEIGANVTVDRATIDATVIGDGTKIDNLVHIAHNCVIGKNVVIVAQVGISGSVEIGDDVTLAGQVGIVGHVTIGSSTRVAARSVVTKDLAPGSFVSGFPAKPHNEETRIIAAMRRLPEMLKFYRKMKRLEEGTDASSREE